MKRLLTFSLPALALSTPFAAAELAANTDLCIPPAVIQALS